MHEYIALFDHTQFRTRTFFDGIAARFQVLNLGRQRIVAGGQGRIGFFLPGNLLLKFTDPYPAALTLP